MLSNQPPTLPSAAAAPRWENGTYIDEAKGFAITLPEGWTEDSTRQKERDEFFHNVKNMGIIAKGIEVTQDMGCPGFFVSPEGDAYVEVHWSESPVLVEPLVAFTYTANDVYHEGYERIGDPVVDPETSVLTQIYTFVDGKAKESITVRSQPIEVWTVTCVATAESEFDTYEATFDEIIDSLILVVVAAPSEEEEEVGPFRITAGPYLQNAQKSGMTIMWETSEEATSEVRYGLEQVIQVGYQFITEAVYTDEVIGEEPTKIHEITLSGLDEATIYHYKVTSRSSSGEVVTSEDAVFKTAPNAVSPFTFIAYGDSRCAIDCTDWDTHQQIAQAMDARRPDLVLHTGDIVMNGEEHSRWLSEFFGPAKDLFKDTPVYASIGNHEANAHWYYDFFSYPQPENYYSFEYGNTHFVAIDSYESIESETEFTLIGSDSAVYQWLVEDLSSSTATWKIVFLHQPIYNSNYELDPSTIELRETLTPVFEEYGVDIVFNGHDHSYERSYPMRNGQIDLENGIPYITTGGGGAEPHGFTMEKKPDFIAEGLVVHHYCLIEIARGYLEMKVFDISGNLIDYMTITK